MISELFVDDKVVGVRSVFEDDNLLVVDTFAKDIDMTRCIQRIT